MYTLILKWYNGNRTLYRTRTEDEAYDLLDHMKNLHGDHIRSYKIKGGKT